MQRENRQRKMEDRERRGRETGQLRVVKERERLVLWKKGKRWGEGSGKRDRQRERSFYTERRETRKQKGWHEGEEEENKNEMHEGSKEGSNVDRNERRSATKKHQYERMK